MKNLVLLLLTMSTILSCEVKDKETTLKIIDNNRHYYPVLQGQGLNVVFKIKNTGNSPFILSDLMTSCGCITSKRSSIKTIPPGGEGRLLLSYNSNKNVGYVKHYITLYGNIANRDKIELVFDVNVVPDSHYPKDYEELFQLEKNREWEHIVEGKENNNAYYLDKAS
ncbi:DUF1573 domain-containing protein [Arenibacter certesii]|uniref:DUF1573 domain-containing protein n=1 Tax=Arenibacter certesii TaxID=228955 RepID=A0A918J3X2_9FLAO|nr:DUF1573 domain-containing protein [Arenibacter certesii]GGW45299.1 hypothetical protein GCM10007383_32050 [Arenibacter certesii]